MYPPPQQHNQPKRRKKRPIHGLKTVDVVRGKSGYGFTISGQHPCVLSCIVNNSPAEHVGLRPGDYLMSVNGKDVSKHTHDDVVCMVGMSTGTLTIEVAENYNSSDSSDDDYFHRVKGKYPHRARKGHKGYNEKMEKLLADINQRDQPDGHTHDQNSRPLPNNFDNKKIEHSKVCSRPRLHTPVGAENHEIQSEGTSYIEAGASNVFKVPFQKSASASNVPSATSLLLHHKVEPKHAFIKSTSQGHVKSLACSRTIPCLPSHAKHSRMYEQFSPNSLQQIINHSLHSYSAANEAFILNEDDFVDADDEDDNVPVPPSYQEVKMVVGYIGSLEMPGDAHQPHVRIQSIRNAVRRLRMEQKIHTLVLMVVSWNIGVTLKNMLGKVIAFYPTERLAFSGVCPDDKRFFGIVTLRSVSDDSNSDSDCRDELVGSSCHVFMVDQELSAHNVHAIKAKSLGINCTVDPHTQRCVEFPRSTTPIILSISSLCKDRPGVGMENDVARSLIFSNPNPPDGNIHTSSTSSNNSNSDSGLGFGKDDDRGERGPDIPEVLPPSLPARDRPSPQLPHIKWSGNTMYLTDGPVKHKKSSEQNIDLNSESLSLAISKNEEYSKPSDKLNIRAMLNASPCKKVMSCDGLENQNTAENLRLGMQKLLQARQRQAGLDQTSSDTESRSSKSDIQIPLSDMQERPVSAPFRYLSGETCGDVQSLQNFVHIQHDSDSILADKLSPRAFLSSAFTPLSSTGSAFSRIHSRLFEMRSPSAPPLPCYHEEYESEEEAKDKIMKSRFQEDGFIETGKQRTETQATTDCLTDKKKRDQELRSEEETQEDVVKPSVSYTEQQTMDKRGSFTRKSRSNPLSLSHESLVVLDQDPVQQKLSSANSVNSIVHHVATSIEEEQVGRVASWAVSFDKLLTDSVGSAVFSEFLRKEFSEENVVFWKACEDFKNIIDSSYRTSKAKDIYETHVCVNASDCVNIDSVARKAVESQLENPTPCTFDVAQQQIFQLMKQDSYGRFLKSSLYKSCLMNEMEGKPLLVDDNTQHHKKLIDKVNEKEGKKKGKGKENEEQKDKRRRSLLPWRQKSKKQNKSDTDSKDQKSIKDTKDFKDNNASTTTTVSYTESSSNSTHQPAHVQVPGTIEEEPEQPRFCRVIMPDGSTTVVGTRQGQTINYILGKLCEKRDLSVASVDVFLLGSEKPLNLNDDISTLGSKEVTIERRVLFRMDLPNKKSIGVKAKPNRLIRDVFKPILNKYGYRIDAIDFHLSGQSDRKLCLDNLVSSIDSQRVIVLNHVSDLPANHSGLHDCYISSRLQHTNKFSSRSGNHGKTNNVSKNNNPNNESLELVTNSIFGNLMLHKSDQILSHNFDDLGILDPESKKKVMIPQLDPCICKSGSSKQQVEGVVSKDQKKILKPCQKVTFNSQKNTLINQSDDDISKGFKELQSYSLCDQQDIGSQDTELGNFNLRTNNISLLSQCDTASSSNYEKVSLSSQKNARNSMSQIDNYIESINENFAAYTRENTVTGEGSYKIDIKRLPVKSSNKNESWNGLIPSNKETDIFFQVPSTSQRMNFDEPFAVERSLKDHSLNRNSNKYLLKSRNFVDHRRKKSQEEETVENERALLASCEMISTTQRNDQLNISDSLKSTLLNNALSSPCYKDSSMDKRYLSNALKNTKVVKNTSRHTITHSPVTGVDGDTCLSTVDTDGKFSRHSALDTFKDATLSNRKTKIPNSNSDEHSTDASQSDEITFV